MNNVIKACNTHLPYSADHVFLTFQENLKQHLVLSYWLLHYTYQLSLYLVQSWIYFCFIIVFTVLFMQVKFMFSLFFLSCYLIKLV